MSTFQERLEQGLKLRDISAAELSKRTGIGEGAISQYRKGAYKASQRNLEKIALALNVSIPWLMGLSDNPSPVSPSSALDSIKNVFSIETKKYPLLGNIACGEPVFAHEEMGLYVEAGADLHADFCLKASGDSMINARIQDGDIVFIRQQSSVEDGEIAAVLIDDEATLKRVYYDKEAGVLSLFAENPKYKTLRYTKDELNTIRILGKAVAFQSDIK